MSGYDRIAGCVDGDNTVIHTDIPAADSDSKSVPQIALQGKVLLIVFGKIQGLCSGGDTLTGIVLKFAAGRICQKEALLGT